MTRQARILLRAQLDLDETAAYIAGDSVAAGMRFLAAFRETCTALLDMPRIGRVFMEIGARGCEIRGCRVKGFANWLIFYQPVELGIEVVRVLHGARDIDGILAYEIEAEPENEAQTNE